jgi:hypothetical protein
MTTSTNLAATTIISPSALIGPRADSLTSGLTMWGSIACPGAK